MEINNVTSISRRDEEIILAGAKFKKKIKLADSGNHVHLSIDKSAFNYKKQPDVIELGPQNFSIDLGLTGLTLSCKKLTSGNVSKGIKDDMHCVLREGLVPEKEKVKKEVKKKKPTSFCEVL